MLGCREHLIFFRLKSSSEIRLAAGNFSTNGVIQYNLTTPIPFQSGDVLGVYQPPEADSVVQLFYVDDSTAPVAYRRTSIPLTYNAFSIPVSNQRMLLLPMTGIVIQVMHAYILYVKYNAT